MAKMTLPTASTTASRLPTRDEVRTILRSRFAGEQPAVDLPLDRPRGSRFVGEAEEVSIALEAEETLALEELANTADVGLESVVITAVVAMLALYGHATELLVGVFESSTSAARGPSRRTMLPLRAAVERPHSVLDTARALDAQLREFPDESKLTLEELVDTIATDLDPSRPPLVAATVERVASLEPKPSAIATDIAVRHAHVDGRLHLGLAYARELVDESNARRMLEGVAVALRAVPSSLAQPIGELPVLTAEERARASFMRTRAEYDASRPIFVRFEEHVARAPDRIAVVCGDDTLTYEQLARRARRLARRLVAEGVGAETLVAIYCERGVDMLVAVLAIELAGGAYVPLDPAHPPSRITAVLEDAAPRVVLTQRAIHGTCPATAGARILDVDDPENEKLDASPVDRPVDPDALAYVIFTSGSTGRPKGVEITHRAFTNFLASMAKSPGMTAADRILSVTTLSFDIAGLELQLPLFVGGSVEIAPRETTIDAQRLMARLANPAITLFQATPATFRLLVDAGWAGESRLRVLCGGEAFPLDLLRALLPRTAEVHNVYGPTETTVWSTSKRLVDDSLPISIGTPIDNTSIVLLSPDGQVVPYGAVGEIWIGGDGVARGYRGRPELTADRFRPDPESEVEGARRYGTGDLGRFAPDGTLVCLGRVDFQVKVRGFRIEPGDIEAAIADDADVRRVVVVAREDIPGDRRLVAYLVVEGDESEVVARVQKDCREKLPAYMVPSAFVVLDALPLNPSGKIDRKALPPPSERSYGAPTGGRGPKDDVEAILASIFREILGIGEVDAETSFFDLGGNSLLAVQLLRRIETDLGRRLSLATLFDGASVAAIATAMAGDPNPIQRPRVVALRRAPPGTDVDVFCVVGVALYQGLADVLAPHANVYGCFLPAETELLSHANLGRGRLVFPSVRTLASDYIRAIRAVRPHGPYDLVGLSFGGVVAYAIAAELRAAGEEVRSLTLLDAILPEAHSPNRLRQVVHAVRPFVKPAHARSAFAKLARGKLGLGTSDFSEAELGTLRDFAYERAVLAYAHPLPRFDGHVVAVAARDRSEYGHRSIDVLAGFRESLDGPVTYLEVDGNHIGIVERPGVEVVGAVLAQVIEERATHAPIEAAIHAPD